MHKSDSILILQSQACSPHGHPVLTLGMGDAINLSDRFLVLEHTRNLPLKLLLTDVPWGKNNNAGPGYLTQVRWPEVVKQWFDYHVNTMTILGNMPSKYTTPLVNPGIKLCKVDKFLS